MMATTSLNPNNPFRTPRSTPQHTGVSAQASETGVATNQPAPSQSEAHGTDLVSSASLFEVITEDAPPAYTPTADPYHGEAAMEFGPYRPFQPAPPPVMGVTVPESAADANVNQNPTGELTREQSRFPPPPRHPSIAPSSSRSSPPRPSTPVSARPPPPRHPSQTGHPQTMYSPPPVQSAPPQSYNPPPGEPPLRRAASSTRRISSAGSRTSIVADDGRPTTTPTPGRPLLRDGKLLVYPTGHECSKCHNTGYKNYDPSHPCRKCWDKYARPYAGALAYAPFPASQSSSASPNGNFQRPLPSFRPPHAQGPTPRPHSTDGYPGAVHRTQDPPPLSHQPSYHPPPQQHFSPPPPHPQQHPYPPHLVGMPTPLSPPSFFHPPPPPPTIFTGPASPYHPAHPPTTVLPPGDARLGGRLCWRCGGVGNIGYAFFGSETCGVCKGVGRVYN